jgi:hypothetical protein
LYWTPKPNTSIVANNKEPDTMDTEANTRFVANIAATGYQGDATETHRDTAATL